MNSRIHRLIAIISAVRPGSLYNSETVYLCMKSRFSEKFVCNNLSHFLPTVANGKSVNEKGI